MRFRGGDRVLPFLRGGEYQSDESHHLVSKALASLKALASFQGPWAV